MTRFYFLGWESSSFARLEEGGQFLERGVVSGRVLDSFERLWGVLLHEYFVAEYFSVGGGVC
jgi:hypothetical protein